MKVTFPYYYIVMSPVRLLGAVANDACGSSLRGRIPTLQTLPAETPPPQDRMNRISGGVGDQSVTDSQIRNRLGDAAISSSSSNNCSERGPE